MSLFSRRPLKLTWGICIALSNVLCLNVVEADPRHKVHGEHKGHHQQKSHHHSFDDPAKWAAKWEGVDRDQQQQPLAVMDHCEISSGMRIVDLGAGTGYFTPYLSERVGPKGQVISLDTEPKMVSWINHKIDRLGLKNVSAQQVSSADPNLKPSSVDRILIVNVWHHIEQRPAYLKRLKSALKPKGSLCVVEIKLDAPYGPPKAYRLSEADLKTELSLGGFSHFKSLELSTQYVLSAELAGTANNK